MRKEKRKIRNPVIHVKTQLIKLKKNKIVKSNKKQYLLFMFPKQTVFIHRKAKNQKTTKEKKPPRKKRKQLKD